jgi:hypothetical protein
MGERPHCEKHNRYLGVDGNCLECSREIREARDEGAAALAQDLMRHFPGDTLLKSVLREMGYEV